MHPDFTVWLKLGWIMTNHGESWPESLMRSVTEALIMEAQKIENAVWCKF